MSPSVRFLVHFTFLYTCVEGLVVNILYPDRLPFIYKDLVLLAIYAGVVLPDLRRLVNPSPLATYITTAIALFSAFVILYVALPSQVPLLSKLVAVKQRLFYIPLLAVAYYFIRSLQDLRALVIALAIYSVGVSAFGVYLFFSGPEGLRALGAGYSAVIFAAQTSVETWRVPGSFTSPGQYSLYLMFNGLVVSALLVDEGAPRWSRLVAIVSLVLMAFAMLASGSRTPMILTSVGVAIALVLSGRLTRVVSWTLGLYVVVAYGFTTLGPGVRDRVGSIASADHIERFRNTYFGQLFATPLLEYPLGVGLGVATIGARHFAEYGQVILMESYYGVLAVEQGWPGVLTFLAVAAAIVMFLVTHRSRMRGSPEGVYWIFLGAFVALIIAVLPVGTHIDNAPGNFYFWFSLGAMVRLVELQHWREWEARQAAAASAANGTVPDGVPS